MNTLRTFKRSEIALYQKWMGSVQVLEPYLNNYYFSLNELIQEYNDSEGWNVARLTRCLYINSMSEIIGFAQFWKVDPFESHVEMGLVILPAHRQCGYGISLTKAILQRAFLHPDIHRVQAITAKQNQHMIKIWDLIGFKVEGTLRKFMLLKHKYEDCLIASLLREEWQKNGKNYIF